MTHNEKIKVLVVDDHEAVRNGVARLLESAAPRLQVAGLARTGAEALELAGTTHPDVIVLDLLLDGENGLDLLPGLKRVCGAAIVILTSVNDTHTRAGALEHGARAWVSKLAPAGDLLAAIDAVAAGQEKCHAMRLHESQAEKGNAPIRAAAPGVTVAIRTR